MKPEVRVFSKDNPCSKLDLWKCFYHPKAGFVRVPIAIAHAAIGLNAPRGMMAKARLYRVESNGKEVYGLTPEGEQWLIAGIRAYVKNHPLEEKAVGPIPASVPPSGRIRRTR